MKVGFIDSGVGGLSIYQHVSRLVQAEYIYMMDNKYLPYGEKSEAFIQQRLRQLSAYLVDQAADMVVIACNTATTQAVEFLRQHFSVPFVGVVPAIKPAAQFGQPFAVLATPATCQSQYLKDLLLEFAPNIEVDCIGSSELVRLAEDKVWYHTDVSQQVADILSVSTLGRQSDSIIVLGCTHFPFLAADIQAGLSRNVRLFDTGEAIARRVKQLIEQMESKQSINCLKRNCFISTRALDKLQVARLSEFGFDQYYCWPNPL